MALPTNVATPTSKTAPTNIGVPDYVGSEGLYRYPTNDLRVSSEGADRVQFDASGIKIMQGGTVSQATSKSTGVTLSKATGEITMDAASLAAGTIVTFTLTNTLSEATDVMILNHASGGTVGSYTLNAQCKAGTVDINVRNNTGVALAEAIVIRFVLIKGATS